LDHVSGQNAGTAALANAPVSGAPASVSSYHIPQIAQDDSGAPMSQPIGPDSTGEILGSMEGLDPIKRLVNGTRRSGSANRERTGYAMTSAIRALLPEPMQGLAVSILENHEMWDQLNTFRDQMREQGQASASLQNFVVGTTTAVTGGFTVGYVVWLIRGGSLLATMASVMPNWASFDPLPVMERFEDELRDEDQESLASIVTGLKAGRSA
jgi:hypothetical protein